VAHEGQEAPRVALGTITLGETLGLGSSTWQQRWEGDSHWTSTEAYSCKNTGDDKKLKVHLDSKYENQDDLPLHAGTSWDSGAAGTLGTSLSKSPFGPFEHNTTSRKTLFYLLATLNAAFPDYDFSDLKPQYFTKLPTLPMIANSIHNLLFVHLQPVVQSIEALEPLIWNTIDDTVQLEDCNFYSFNPDREMEPDAENGGNLWSFYYFFFNKKLKRMVFFTARAVRYILALFRLSQLTHATWNTNYLALSSRMWRKQSLTQKRICLSPKTALVSPLRTLWWNKWKSNTSLLLGLSFTLLFFLDFLN
jgi:hypothetical protein